MAGAAQADRAGCDAGGCSSGYDQPLGERPVRSHPRCGAVAQGRGDPGQNARRRTCVFALHMSAFGGKADMTVCGKSAFAVAIWAKADMTFCTAYVGL